MIKIIAAYAGTGKTHFASLYPDILIDLVSMPYKYLLKEDTSYDESSKANPKNIPNDDWPFNYISSIKQNLESGKIMIIPSDLLILRLLREENLRYCLCYTLRNAKEIYRERYLKRGNSKDFIDIFISDWNKFMDCFEKDPYGQHIVLQPNQFLSDVIDISMLTPNQEAKTRQSRKQNLAKHGSKNLPNTEVKTCQKRK
jgi:hypothetical protein